MISELEAILDNVDQATIIKLIKKIFKGTKFTTIKREEVTDGVKLHFKFIDGTEIVSPIIYELTDADVTILKQKVAELENKINGLLTKTDQLEDRVGIMDAKLYELTSDFNTLEDTVDHLLPRVHQLENDVTGLESDVTDIKEEQVDLRQTINSVASDVQNLTSDVNNLRTSVTNVETRTTNLETFTQSLNTNLLALTQRVNDINTHITEIDNHLDSHDASISQLEVRVANIENALTDKADKTELAEANNGEPTTGTLTSLKVRGVNYQVPQGGTGTDDYNNLNNKPTIDGVELTKGKTHSELGLLGTVDKTELQAKDQELETNKADKTELPVANNGESATTDLATLKVGGVNYKIPSGGSGDKYYRHIIVLTSSSTPRHNATCVIINKSASPYTLNSFLENLNIVISTKGYIYYQNAMYTCLSVNQNIYDTKYTLRGFKTDYDAIVDIEVNKSTTTFNDYVAEIA